LTLSYGTYYNEGFYGFKVLWTRAWSLRPHGAEKPWMHEVVTLMLCKDHPIQSKWLLVSSGGHLTWWKISYTAEVVLCNIRPDKVPLKFTRKYQTGLYDGVKIHIIGSCKIITPQNNNVAMLQMMGRRSNSTPGLFKDGGRACDGTTQNGEHLTSLWVEKTHRAPLMLHSELCHIWKLDIRLGIVFIGRALESHHILPTVPWWCSGVSSHHTYCSFVVLWNLITLCLVFLGDAMESHKSSVKATKNERTRCTKPTDLWKYWKNNS